MNRLVLIYFEIKGRLRYLSHSELIRLFQRACARAGIRLAYAGRFNPRPKLDLPLPKPVAVEADADILTLRLDAGNSQTQPSEETCRQIKDRLNAQLPLGCKVISVFSSQSKDAVQPTCAEYLFELQNSLYQDPGFRRQLHHRIENLIKEPRILLRRSQKNKSKQLDVRPFILSIVASSGVVRVRTKITNNGTIRVNELENLLNLENNMLARPVRRVGICCQQN